MTPRNLLVRLFAWVALVQMGAAAWGTVKRTASVAVVNNSPQRITGVTVMHKYSSVYRDRSEWEAIEAGQMSEATMTVQYNTGPFTTGTDWWLLTWYTDDETKLHYTDPQNFRWIFDSIEGAGATDGFKDPLYESDGTAGFKQHILRTQDEGEVTKIIVNDDGSVTLQSNSGISNTRASYKVLRKPSVPEVTVVDPCRKRRSVVM